MSVLMAVYNCAPYLPAALDSVLGQTFSKFELVVVDDASSDDTPRVLQAYARRDARFVLLRNEQNLRLPASLNRGLGVCRAPIVARADGDDLCDRKRLERQLNFLQQNPQVGVVSCGYKVMDAEGRPLGSRSLPVQGALIKFKLLWESPLCHPGALYRRDLVRAVGAYAEAYSTAQDYELWARLRDRTEFANLREKLVTVRRHEACSTAVYGKETSHLGRIISGRLLSAYLGRELANSETAALTTLLCACSAASGDDLRSALPLLDALLDRAKARELASTWRWARREISRSLLKQAYYLSYSSPSSSRELLHRALLLYPPTLLSEACVLQLCRLLLGRFRA